MSVVVEPILTEEKLRGLLLEGHEQSSLDYKKELSLDNRRDIIELAKDIAAMQAEESGGYIVVGADDYGKIVPGLTHDKVELLDEARLRAKLRKYIAEPFDVRSATHTIEGNTVVLIYVAPNSDGWCIFVADGDYEEEHPSGSGKLRKKTVFRHGDVFVRRGTASERWQDADRARLLRQVIERRKDEWRSELRAEFAATVDAGLNAQQIEQLPAGAMTWKLDAEGFNQLATELIRRRDDIPLRHMLLQARADASSLLPTELDDLSTLLNRVCSLAALAITYERIDWLTRATDTLVGIYELGFDHAGYQRHDINAPRLWLYTIARVEALGGLAVRLQFWEAVRQLADRLPNGNDFDRSYGSWIRHALTMAARAKILDDEQNAGLIARAHNVVRTVGALHSDAEADSNAVLNSLCQFDALAALVAIGERHATHRSNFYPSFARYYSERTIPALVTMVTNPSVRKKLFADTDSRLAESLKELSTRAHQEGIMYNGWDGLEDSRVISYIEKNMPE